LAIPSIIFCYQFMSVLANVTLPFYIQSLSPESPDAGLRWTGWSLGIVPLMAIATTPLWMRWADGQPRAAYVLSQTFQGCCYLLTAAARTFPEIFLSRLLLGASGPAQSLALVIVGRSGSPNVRGIVSAVQSVTTLAASVGPLGAAALGGLFGFRSAFVAAGIAMWLCGGAVQLSVAAPGPHRAEIRTRAPRSWTEVGVVCMLALVGYSQVYLLTAILPTIVPPFGVEASRALAVGGWILVGSGVALAVGSLGASALAGRIGERQTLIACLVAASMCLVVLGVAADPLTFGAIRALEMLFIAPVIVLATTRVTQAGDSQAIGLVNTSRIVAGFTGPVIATHLLVWYASPVMFAVIGLASLTCLPFVFLRWGRDRGSGAGGSETRQAPECRGG
jgi:MFS family permease